MAGGMGHGSGSQSMSGDTLARYDAANDRAGQTAQAGQGPSGKGTSQAAPTTTPPPEISGPRGPMLRQPGKGTNPAAPTDTQSMPPSVMGRYSGAPQRGGWQDTLARGINQQQMRAAATPMPTGDYNQMVSQALLGKKWEDLVPQPAKKEEPAAAPAPAPDKVAALEAQLAALQQAQQAATAPAYDPGFNAAGRAHGGAIHGYAAGGSPSEDEILKLAFNIIRRKFQ